MEVIKNKPAATTVTRPDDMRNDTLAFEERKVMLIYHDLQKDCSEELPASNRYRLLFLLEGKVQLKCGNGEEYLLDGQEFTLLPPGNRVVCYALAPGRTKYLVIHCNRSKIGSNAAYLEELKKRDRKDAAPCRQLPIRERLMKVLKDFDYYPVSESTYPSLYDILFIYMRTLYTPEELLSLLGPVLLEGGEGKR